MTSLHSSSGQLASKIGDHEVQTEVTFTKSRQVVLDKEVAYFRSRKIVKGSTERPWLGRKDPREKWLTIIPFLGILLGLIVGGYLIWDGARNVAKHSYCKVLDEDWSSGLNTKIWTREAEVGGFGYVPIADLVLRFVANDYKKR